MNARQLGGMDSEHVGQHAREILQQMEAVGHLAGGGRPEARRFRIRLRPIPDDHLDPGMGLQPLRYGRGLSVGQQGQGPPLFEIQQEGAVGVTLPQRELVHAEDVRGADRRAGGTTDHAQEGVAADGEAERPAQSDPSRPPEGQADSEEAGHQPQRAPGPRCGNARQALGEDAARAHGIAAEQLADAQLPGDAVATPGEIGECSGVRAMDIPGGDIAPRAVGCGLGGSDQESDPGACVVEVPGVQVERCGCG